MRVPLRRTTLIATVLFGLAALFYLPPFKIESLAATLDNSWIGVITWDAAKPLRFLISPLLQTDPDPLDFLNGNHPEAEIRAVRILPPAGAKWFLPPRIAYQFSEISKVNENIPPASP